MAIITYLKKLFKRLFSRKEDTMPSGLQVFDETGVETVGLTDRLTKVSGVKRFDVVEPSGSVTVELSAGQHIWYFLNSCADATDGELVTYGGTYNTVVDGGTLSWVLKKPDNLRKPCKIALVYGGM